MRAGGKLGQLGWHGEQLGERDQAGGGDAVGLFSKCYVPCYV